MSLVLELQKDAMSSHTPISDLLRKALLVARKLNIKEFEQWISSEVNGYPEQGTELPKYRDVVGIVMAHNPYRGWIPFHISNPDLADAAARRGFAQPISEIDNLLESQKDEPICIVYYPPKFVPMLMSMMTVPMTPALHIPKAQLHKMIEAVRTIVLEWSLKLEQDGILGEGMSFSKEERELASLHTYHIETYIGQMYNSQLQQDRIIGEKTMGDSYKVGQAGAIGPNAHAHNMTFNQIWNEIQVAIDLEQLAAELSRLRQEMKKEAIEPEQDIAVSEIAKAEQAAKSGDGSKTLEHLKSAGKWAFDVATKVGTSLAVEAMKKSM